MCHPKFGLAWFGKCAWHCWWESLTSRNSNPSTAYHDRKTLFVWKCSKVTPLRCPCVTSANFASMIFAQWVTAIRWRIGWYNWIWLHSLEDVVFHIGGACFERLDCLGWVDVAWIASDVDCIRLQIAYFYSIALDWVAVVWCIWFDVVCFGRFALDSGLQTTPKRSPKRSPKQSRMSSVSAAIPGRSRYKKTKFT